MVYQKSIQSESGRTMLEMLGVLGIMGIIMYGAVAGINYGMNTYKVNQVYTEVQEAIQGIEDLYSWSSKYTEDINKYATDPANEIFVRGCQSGADAQCKNAFDGSITVAQRCSGRSFKIIYVGVPQSECERLQEMEWGTVVMQATCAANSDIYFCPRTKSSQNGCSDQPTDC